MLEFCSILPDAELMLDGLLERNQHGGCAADKRRLRVAPA